MDLNALEMFVLAAETGSLSSAARRGGIPLPTLSRRIRALEKQLGARLLERGAQRLALTDAGRRLYERAAPGLEVLADAKRSAMDAHASMAGTLRVSIPPDFEPWWDLLARFQRIHPQAALQVLVSERRVDLVADGIDVALRVGELGDSEDVARPVAAYRHVLVASPSLLAGSRPITRPAHLDGLPCGAFGLRPDRTRWELGGKAFVFTPRVVANQYASLRALALAGACITELPPFLARDHLARGELVRVLPQMLMPDKRLSLVFPSNRFVPTLVREYIDFCARLGPALVAGSPPPP